MLLCRRPLLFASDALGAIGIGALAVGLVMFVVLPTQRAAEARPMLQSDVAEAQDRYEIVTARNRVLGETIRTLEGRVGELSVARLSDSGEFLEFVSRVCAESGFHLQQVTPQGVQSQGERRSWDAQMRVSGPFAAFPRLLSRIEAWSPFVHIRELSVVGPAEGTSGDCEFGWTVRVNYLAPTTAEARPQ